MTGHGVGLGVESSIEPIVVSDDVGVRTRLISTGDFSRVVDNDGLFRRDLLQPLHI